MATKCALAAAAGLSILLCSCAAWTPPERVDHLGALGVDSNPGSGSIRDLKGKRVSLVLGENMVRSVQFGKDLRDDTLSRYFVGGKEQMDAIADPNVPVRSYAAMLKAHFPDIRLARGLSEAQAVNPAATVVADFFLDQKGHDMSNQSVTWDGRLDFLVPPSSRRIHRTVRVTRTTACPNSGLELCRNRARDEMLAELQRRFDDAMKEQ